MARGVNKVTLIGNLGKDPETRYMPNGGAVTNVTIATSMSWKNKQTGQQEEKTEWHNVVFFNKLAEIAGEYLKKGSKIYTEGYLRTRKWQDKSGNDRYTTEVVGKEIQMLDSRASNSDKTAAPAANNNSSALQPNNSSPVAQANNSGPAPMPEDYQSEPDFDDDIPFDH